jgi:hypothetical protein
VFCVFRDFCAAGLNIDHPPKLNVLRKINSMSYFAGCQGAARCVLLAAAAPA